MSKPIAKRIGFIGLALLLIVLWGYTADLGQLRTHESAASLTDLHSIEELQALFNQDKGVPRLVLLLSPT